MMRRVLLGSLIGMVLISCSPTPAQIPVNLEHVDLEQLVLQPDDFPPNTLMGTLTEPYNVPIHGRDPQIVKQYLRHLESTPGSVEGQIYVTLYRDTSVVRSRYESQRKIMQYPAMTQFPVQSVALGDEAIVQHMDETTRLQFTRCHAHAILDLPIAKESMVSYAQRLDARLKPVVCP